MNLLFTLSMPGCASWNGKWSGEGKFYGVVRSVSSAKKNAEKYQALLEKGYFHYNFGDGWAACVEVKRVDAKEARAARKASKGFCGYEWMFESILTSGKIIARQPS